MHSLTEKSATLFSIKARDPSILKIKLIGDVGTENLTNNTLQIQRGRSIEQIKTERFSYKKPKNGKLP